MSEPNEDIKKLALKALDAEFTISRMLNSGILRDDIYKGVNEVLKVQQEVRFFLHWVAAKPEDLAVATERLIDFLTEGYLIVNFSSREVTPNEKQ